jgi:hypothetical protein
LRLTTASATAPATSRPAARTRRFLVKIFICICLLKTDAYC